LTGAGFGRPPIENEEKMRRKILIKLPDDVNPNSLLTFNKAANISGIPIRTLYEWRRQPWRGLQVYKLGRRVFVQAEEFVRWANMHIKSAD